MSYLNKANVLFLECGSSGQGGSFRSLKEHIEIMRDMFNKIIIVLVNESVFEQDYLNLDCVVIKLKHPIYSQGSRWRSIYNKCFALCRRLSPTLTLYLQIFFEFKFAKQISELIKIYHIKLIHLNDQPMRNFSGFLASKKMNIAVVSHIRTLHTFGFTVTFANYIRTVRPKFIAISNAVRIAWESFGLESEVIYNPVPICLPTEYVEKKYDLIYVGRLEEGKGVEDLLDSVAILPSVTLAILGEGSLKEALIHLSNSLKLSERVFFLGYSASPLQCIKQARILVIPSKNEGMSRVLVEAMKLKVPVIANQVGGMVELIENKTTGIMYKAEENKALAESILLLLRDTVLYSNIQRDAYSFSINRFCPRIYFEQFHKQYHFDF